MNVADTAIRWLDQLLHPDSAAFAELFTEDGMYVDPAFGLARKGREFVRLHHQKWHAAIPDFGAKIERVLVDGLTATLLYEGWGTFNGKPLGMGENALQPTNRQFKARAVIILDLNESGLVKCCTEYYDRSVMPMGVKTPYADNPQGLQ
jgi:hypothetical protein